MECLRILEKCGNYEGLISLVGSDAHVSTFLLTVTRPESLEANKILSLGPNCKFNASLTFSFGKNTRKLPKMRPIWKIIFE